MQICNVLCTGWPKKLTTTTLSKIVLNRIKVCQWY